MDDDSSGDALPEPWLTYATTVTVTVEPGIVWVSADIDLSDGAAYAAADVRIPAPGRIEVDLLEGTFGGLATMAMVPLTVRVPAQVSDPGSYDVAVNAGHAATVTVPPPPEGAGSSTPPKAMVAERYDGWEGGEGDVEPELLWSEMRSRQR